MTDDHGNSPATATAISVGDTVAGEIEFGSDVDFFAVELQASGRYAFQTTLLDLSDSVLYLYGPDGWTLLDLGDDIAWPDDPSSRIEWVAETSGTYYLAVEAYDLTDVGTYTLDVELINFLPVLEPLDDCMMELDDDCAGRHPDGARRRRRRAHLFGSTYSEPTPMPNELMHSTRNWVSTSTPSAIWRTPMVPAKNSSPATRDGTSCSQRRVVSLEGTIDSSVLVATFSPRYHLDPALLHDAVLPFLPTT